MSIFAAAMAEAATAAPTATPEEMEQMVTKAAATGGLIALGVGVLIAIAIAWFVIQVIADWKIFEKAGEPGWKSIIPFYNIYVEYDICWTGLLGLVFICATLVTSLVNTANASNIVKILVIVLGVVACVLHFLQSVKLSKSFGKGTGFGLVLFFLGPIGRIILGFGDSRYIGPQ